MIGDKELQSLIMKPLKYWFC